MGPVPQELVGTGYGRHRHLKIQTVGILLGFPHLDRGLGGNNHSLRHLPPVLRVAILCEVLC